MLIGVIAGLIGLALGVFGVLAFRVSEQQRKLVDVEFEDPVPSRGRRRGAGRRRPGVCGGGRDRRRRPRQPRRLRLRPGPRPYAGPRAAAGNDGESAARRRHPGTAPRTAARPAGPGDHRGPGAGGRDRGGIHPAAGRRPDRGHPHGGSPQRLRRQRVPRTEDAGRRHLAAGRGARILGRRPGSRAPLRQTHPQGVRPPGGPGAGHHRTLPAAGLQRREAGPGGGHQHRRRRGRGPVPAAGGKQEHRPRGGRAVGRDGLRRPGPAGDGVAEPDRQRHPLLPGKHPGRRRHPGQGRPRGGLRDGPGRGAQPRGPGTRLRALLPRGRRPVTPYRRHRPWPEHRQARRRQPRRRGDPLVPARAGLHLHHPASGAGGPGPRRRCRRGRAGLQPRQATQHPRPTRRDAAGAHEQGATA